MPVDRISKDIFHDIFLKALIKEDWMITDEPLRLRFGVITFQVDLRAEKVIGAGKMPLPCTAYHFWCYLFMQLP